MGGFHLSGPFFEPIIDRTAEELHKFQPAYVIPTHCTGRKATRPGRAIIRDHRAELDASEGLAGAHLAAWRAGEISDVSDALTVAYDQWQALAPGEHLVFEWPSPAGTVAAHAGA